MRDVVLVGAKRTPIGSFLGSLVAVPATRLGSISIKAALEHAKVAPAEVGEVYMGCVMPAGLGQAPARQAALGAGLPNAVPCTTVNKVCGSGLKSVLLAAQSIASGDVDVAVGGGMESMSNTPHLVKMRAGLKLGKAELIDSMVVDGLWDVYSQQHMASCAEACAREMKISREAQDQFAAESYRRALTAQKEGLTRAEIAPVVVPGKGGETTVDTDDEPARGDVAKFPRLRPAFEEGGTITPGNASKLNDGAAALVLMAREVAERRGVRILARVVAHGGHAQEPERFPTAPAVAIEVACKRAGWKPTEVDLWEINEAFSVVSLANNQLLGLDPAKVNPWGGAVALGHPIGASGARILVTLLHAMEKRGARTGGASLCIGGGEALTLLVERMKQ